MNTPKQLNFLGWIVLLMFLYALNKTGVGHEVIYYGLVLIALYLFTANAGGILSVLTK